MYHIIRCAGQRKAGVGQSLLYMHALVVSLLRLEGLSGTTTLLIPNLVHFVSVAIRLPHLG